MTKYYYLYHTEKGKGVNVKYSENGELILYPKRSIAEHAISYGLQKSYLKEMASKLIIKEIEL